MVYGGGGVPSRRHSDRQESACLCTAHSTHTLPLDQCSLAQVNQVLPGVEGCEQPDVFYLGNVMHSQRGQGCFTCMLKQTPSAISGFRFLSPEMQWRLQIIPFDLVLTPLLP